MQDIVVAIISAISLILVAKIQNDSKKRNKEQEERAFLRARESKLSMDMMYACCILSKGTAIALKNNHFNSEVDNGIKLVDEATNKYNTFLRETAANSMND